MVLFRGCNAAHVGAMVAAHGPSAGSGGGAEARAPIRRRRAHSHRPGLCSDKWGASCPDCGAVAGGRRRASGARPSAAVGAMAVLVLRSRSKRCRRLGAERPPVHATARSDPATIPPAQQTRKGGHHASRRGALPSIRLPAATPQPSPPQSRRASDPSTYPRDSQSKEASQSKDQPPLLPPDPLQKSEKNLKDNPKWRIN